MLVELTVNNFAVIEKLTLSLHPGLNLLTGETGAGKSLVVDAVAALLGARIDPSLMRSGAPSAHIEGIFQLPALESSPLRALLKEQGLDQGEEETLIVSREIHRTGRSVARINGRAVPVAFLREVGGHLVDIHGQTEHLSLLDNRRQLEFLDAFGQLEPTRRQFQEKVIQLRSLQREWRSLLQDEQELERKRDLLHYQLEEIEKARPVPGEEEDLRKERDLLANARQIKEACLRAYGSLYSREGFSALDMLHHAKGSIKEVATLDPRLGSYAQSLEDIALNLEEIARDIRAYAYSIEDDPQRLEQVEERLALLQRLKRKYGATLEEVLAYGEQAREELARLGHREERRQTLGVELEQVRQAAAALACHLSRGREEASQELVRRVRHELQDLGMSYVEFRVSLSREEDPQGLPFPDGRCYAFTETGVDRMEFLVTTNPGEPLKPLSRVASGGETSRLMLALKSALREVESVPTLIFDEIDIGVGGRSAEVIGKKLWALGRLNQVICVTHLPQIAAFADAHFRVIKEVVLGHTFTQVQPVRGEAQVQELAAMLGGGSEKLKEVARELLAQAQAWKRKQKDV